MQQTFGNIKELIDRVFYDIKAEAIVADLLEKGLKTDEFVAIQKGIFKRRYARDIDSIERIKLKNNQSILGFKLNRDGLYDSLPEGLFHKKLGNETNKNKKFSENSVELKQEEKAARDFFLPFENEIFTQRVNLELEERKVLGRFSERIFNDIYPELLKIHRSVNREYVYRMVLLLHLSHKIVGNMELTAHCLQSIIEEKVEAKLLRKSKLNQISHDTKTLTNGAHLGKGTLGINFICGNTYKTQTVECQFTIGPLQNTKADDYLENGSLTKFLECFYGYFIPIEFDVNTHIIVSDSDQNFKLGVELEGPVLGFETTL